MFYPSSCSEDGLHTVLGYRNISRLHATMGLLGLSLMNDTSSDTWLMESLTSETCVCVCVCDVLLFPTDVCSDSTSEESIETLSEQITLSEFVIKPGEEHSPWCVGVATSSPVYCRYSPTTTGPLTLAAGTGHQVSLNPVIWKHHCRKTYIHCIHS